MKIHFFMFNLSEKQKPRHGIAVPILSLKYFKIGIRRFTTNPGKSMRRFCRMKENENICSVKLPRRSGVTVNVSFLLEPHHQIVNAEAWKTAQPCWWAIKETAWITEMRPFRRGWLEKVWVLRHRFISANNPPPSSSRPLPLLPSLSGLTKAKWLLWFESRAASEKRRKKSGLQLNKQDSILTADSWRQVHNTLTRRDRAELTHFGKRRQTFLYFTQSQHRRGNSMN